MYSNDTTKTKRTLKQQHQPKPMIHGSMINNAVDEAMAEMTDTGPFHNPEPSSCHSFCNGNRGSGDEKSRNWGNKGWNNDHDTSDIDIKLAAEMNALSMKERQRALEDVHGVTEAQEETAEDIEAAIAGFDKAASKLPRSIRKALDHALFLRPELQSDTEFKLRFIRADLFDVEKAAKRMANYFTWKQKIFGDKMVNKRLALEDLEEQDQKIVKSGCFMKVPWTDPMSRPIIFVDFSRFDLSDQESMIRAAWYHITSNYNDVNAQRNGIVNITYCPGKILEFPHSLSSFADHFRRVDGSFSAVPLRITSYHFCYDDPGLRMLLSGIQNHFGKAIRIRTRPHFGSPVEQQYLLMSYGISCVEPFFQGGDKRQAYLDEVLQNLKKEDDEEKRKMEEEEARTGIIVHPKPEDALIGRGHPYHEYGGTRRLLRLIDSELDRYNQNDDKFWKTCVAMEVVKRVQEYNGRFLYRTKEGWKVIDDVAARGKVVGLFRYKKRMNLSQEGNNNASRKRTKVS